MLREQIVTPDHPRWSEFISRLGSARICFGDTRHARGVLAEFPEVDVEASIRALTLLGGRCDCEIEHDIAPIGRPSAEPVNAA